MVVEAVEDMGHLWHRQVVRFRIDNSAFQQSAVKGWSRAQRLTFLLRRLFELCIKHECVLVFDWVSTRENRYADALSRFEGHDTFLEFVGEGGFLLPGAVLRRDPRCGQARQIGDTYSSNTLKDGPKAAKSDHKLSVPYQRASVYVGIPNQAVTKWLEDVLDSRLGTSSHRSINAALGHWDRARGPHGWARVIASDDPQRGGKLVTFVWQMSENTDLVGASIANYVWAFRQWLKAQRQLDPIYGIMEWDDFMQGVQVKTFVPAEPRKKVPLWLVRDALEKVDKTSFWQVQAAHLMLVLLFTFSRSETPVAKAYSGDEAFDAAKQVTVADIKVVRGALWVRLKGIKQDPRMQRPSAHGNEDWVVIGDVKDSVFSISTWTQLLFQFHGQKRAQDAPFYLARDRVRPYIYKEATKDVRELWANVVGPAQAKTWALHGLRVAGYDNARRGPGGLELAVAHGGWMSTAHRRYARFGDEHASEVVGLAGAIVDQLVEQQDDDLDDGVSPAQTALARTTPTPPTRIPARSHVRIWWTEERQWFYGRVSSQRKEGDSLVSRVVYDDQPTPAFYHDLDDEIWEFVVAG